MRFGISATSWIFPKNLRTRLRPIKVCAVAISSFLRRTAWQSGRLSGGPPSNRDRPDRRQAPNFVHACYATQARYPESLNTSSAPLGDLCGESGIYVAESPTQSRVPPCRAEICLVYLNGGPRNGFREPPFVFCAGSRIALSRDL